MTTTVPPAALQAERVATLFRRIVLLVGGQLLVTHPAILDAAVVRKADEEAGEVPKAYVVLKGDDAARATTSEAIMGWVAGRVAPHKRIRHLEFIDQIPKSASGKILRRVLIDRG